VYALLRVAPTISAGGPADRDDLAHQASHRRRLDLVEMRVLRAGRVDLAAQVDLVDKGVLAAWA
jgi:hypothetical protein